MLLRVIVAAKDPPLRRRLHRLLEGPDLAVQGLKLGRLLWERVGRCGGDVLLISEALVPEPVPEHLSFLRNLPESPSIVLFSKSEDPDRRARLLGAGCEAVLHAGLPEEVLGGALAEILDRRRKAADARVSRQRLVGEPRLADFVSLSPAMQAFMGIVGRVVHSDTSLLIVGETGVGKERLARAIHAEGARANGPFVAVNCGALPESLLESELFGHEEGAFTGATRSRRGCFELAHGGTVFLDEIAETPSHLQVRLLRVLQDHEIQRVGGERPFGVDVRVMASTNRDLTAQTEEGNFRKDLYYRLGVVTLVVPPLRERREDVPGLVESYLDYFQPRIGGNVSSIADDALEALARYPWPGNVRELINVIERAVLLCGGDRIALEDLPEDIRCLAESPEGTRSCERTWGAALGRAEDWLNRPMKAIRAELLEKFERTYLQAALRETGGRVGEAAARAGISARALLDKMKRYGLRKRDFRTGGT